MISSSHRPVSQGVRQLVQLIASKPRLIAKSGLDTRDEKGSLLDSCIEVGKMGSSELAGQEPKDVSRRVPNKFGLVSLPRQVLRIPHSIEIREANREFRGLAQSLHGASDECGPFQHGLDR